MFLMIVCFSTNFKKYEENICPKKLKTRYIFTVLCITQKL